jgi:hypothetical protein
MVDYTKCGVCGLPLEKDRMHILIDNGRVMRHTYAHRRHRYVEVNLTHTTQVQTRTDLEIEHLAFLFRLGQLKEGWE